MEANVGKEHSFTRANGGVSLFIVGIGADHSVHENRLFGKSILVGVDPVFGDSEIARFALTDEKPIGNESPDSEEGKEGNEPAHCLGAQDARHPLFDKLQFFVCATGRCAQVAKSGFVHGC